MSDKLPALISPEQHNAVEAISNKLSYAPLYTKHLWPKDGNPEQAAANIYAAIQTGLELGLSTMMALRNAVVIHEAIGFKADGIAAIIVGSSACEYLIPIETTAQISVWETKRKGHPKPVRYTFTMDDARRAGLTERKGSLYGKFPARMLSARCKAFLARDVYPDVMAGVYTDEEVESFRPPVTTVSEPPQDPTQAPCHHEAISAELTEDPQKSIKDAYRDAIFDLAKKHDMAPGDIRGFVQAELIDSGVKGIAGMTMAQLDEAVRVVGFNLEQEAGFSAVLEPEVVDTCPEGIQAQAQEIRSDPTHSRKEQSAIDAFMYQYRSVPLSNGDKMTLASEGVPYEQARREINALPISEEGKRLFTSFELAAAKRGDGLSEAELETSTNCPF